MTNVRRTLTYGAALRRRGVRRVGLGCARRLRWPAPDLTPFLMLAIAFVVVMSLGPMPRAGGRQVVGLGLYDLFFT